MGRLTELGRSLLIIKFTSETFFSPTKEECAAFFIRFDGWNREVLSLIRSRSSRAFFGNNAKAKKM